MLTREHFRQARGNKAIIFLNMRADDFLYLTTPNEKAIEQISKEAKTRREYVAWALRGETIIPPLLKLFAKTGKVTGHEGRHRAAAILNEKKDATMWVAIIITDEDYGAMYYYETSPEGKPWSRAKHYYGYKDVPEILEGQFSKVRVKVKPARHIPLWEGK